MALISVSTVCKVRRSVLCAGDYRGNRPGPPNADVFWGKHDVDLGDGKLLTGRTWPQVRRPACELALQAESLALQSCTSHSRASFRFVMFGSECVDSQPSAAAEDASAKSVR